MLFRSYYFQLIQALARHYRFDLDTPYRKLPAHIQEILLYGSGDTEIDFDYLHERRGSVRRRHPFEGVIHNMQRRYRETDSNVIREELARYLSHKPCPSCRGMRLNTAARHVFINDYSLPAITALSIERAQQVFASLHLAGQRAEIAARLLKEVNDRLQFLNNVGLNYLTLDRSAETLSGGEAQQIGRAHV